MKKIAALFVETNGVYYGLRTVDPWDEQRDARTYNGPWPVVAHPPCNRWAMPLAKVNQTRYGHRIGDDGGCFKFALYNVRRYGGVLEHPANTAAWRVFKLLKPIVGTWQQMHDGNWVTQVSQRAYGHPARKRTWLYANFGTRTPPKLNWTEPAPIAVTSWLQKTNTTLPRICKKEACRTPIEFRNLLLSLAKRYRL